jgi:hypothetical protein
MRINLGKEDIVLVKANMEERTKIKMKSWKECQIGNDSYIVFSAFVR